MKIIEINSKALKQKFHFFPKALYKGDENWTCPLDAEIEGIFNPKKNNCFKNGEAIRWILVNTKGKTIGRIAAFYNIEKANHPQNDQPTGGIGFFECVNNQEAANKLFDVAKAWLASKGMQAMDGPINFGDNYVHWGLLVRGFTHQAYGMQYHFPYYQQLFENYGFKDYFQQYSYHVDLTKPYPRRQVQFARFVMRKPNYSWKHLEFMNYKKYLTDAAELYNTIWSDFHEDYTPLTAKDFEGVFLDAKPLINEEFIVFAYDEEKPIGMIICFPDLNQAFKKLKNGKLNIINKLKLLYHKKHAVTRARALVAGVIPEYQKSGIVGPLFLKMNDALKKYGITELELSWVGDYNPTVKKIYEQMENSHHAKTHITYRYLFDREKPFKRFTNESSAKNQREKHLNKL